MKESNQQHADIFLHHGHLITMDPSKPQASALAIKDGYIAWVGDSNNSNPWIGKNTQVIDLKNSYVYPGFIDTHMHVLYTGIVKSHLQLQQCSDKQAILTKVRERVKNCQKEEWIIGVG